MSPNKTLVRRTCIHCEAPFLTVHLGQKFCEAACRREYERAAWENGLEGSALSPSSRGALAELAVAADLVRQGYSVFRAVTPDTPVDLIRERDGLMERIEVRLATRNTKRGVMQFSTLRLERSDVVALYFAVDGHIEYMSPTEAVRNKQG